jgi:hypothetical protein
MSALPKFGKKQARLVRVAFQIRRSRVSGKIGHGCRNRLPLTIVMDDMGVTEARTWKFELPKITVRELLRSRVAREVEFYIRIGPRFSRDSFSRKSRSGFSTAIVCRGCARSIRNSSSNGAIRAFRRTHLCCWQADDRSKRWTKRSTSRPRTGVEFLKLVPLAGG